VYFFILLLLFLILPVALRTIVVWVAGEANVAAAVAWMMMILARFLLLRQTAGPAAAAWDSNRSD
jgi:hypothetical protein